MTSSPSPGASSPASAEPFGTLPDGRPVREVVLGRAPGVQVHLLELGATVHRLLVPCGDGVRREVALGHPTVADYLAGTDYLGATVGRYANRIAGGRFPLDGREVQVAVSDRGNHLHGGPDGFHRRLWLLEEHGADHATFTLHSPDGDQGFPGALDVRASYRVEGTALELALEAETTAATVVNLTSHLYLNLDGVGTGTIDGHTLQVDADAFTPVDATGIPEGPPAAVAGTPFDLRRPRRVGEVVRAEHPQLREARGLDHDFVITGSGLRRAARLASARTRTVVDVLTDQPDLQVYTGNFFDGSGRSADGGRYRQGDGIALEPQLPPDSPNRSDVPSPVLRPGSRYRATIRWEFGSLDAG